jgi:hypothetical protein
MSVLPTPAITTVRTWQHNCNCMVTAKLASFKALSLKFKLWHVRNIYYQCYAKKFESFRILKCHTNGVNLLLANKEIKCICTEGTASSKASDSLSTSCKCMERCMQTEFCYLFIHCKYKPFAKRSAPLTSHHTCSVIISDGIIYTKHMFWMEMYFSVWFIFCTVHIF